jgi:PleD family two-component response regulator
MSAQSHPRRAQLALVVGGGADMLEAVEPVMNGARWAIEFVGMNDEPYATVVAMRPDLVVVNLGLDEPAGFSLLAMLRLDPRTRGIPVLSYVGDDRAGQCTDLLVKDSGQLPLDALMPSRAPRH